MCHNGNTYDTVKPDWTYVMDSIVINFNYNQKPREKFQQGFKKMVLIDRCICSIVREMNPAPCDSYMCR